MDLCNLLWKNPYKKRVSKTKRCQPDNVVKAIYLINSLETSRFIHTTLPPYDQNNKPLFIPEKLCKNFLIVYLESFINLTTGEITQLYVNIMKYIDSIF